MPRLTQMGILSLAAVLMGAVMGSPGPALAQTPVDVSLIDPVQGGGWGVIANPTSADAGQITFNVTNDGGLPHNLRVIDSDLAPGSLPIDETKNVVDEGAVNVVGSSVDMSSGGQDSVETDLGPGAYVLICNIPGHYSAGMYAAFQVTGELPPTDTPSASETPGETPTGGGPTTTPGATGTPAGGVTGLGDTGRGGPAQASSSGGWWLLTLAGAGVALVAAGVLASRRSR